MKSVLPPTMRRRLRRWIQRDWFKDAVGGLWEEVGQLQLRFLRQHGLTPEDYLLDVGCGALRGGLHFVRFLEDGHYYGVDANSELLLAGKRQLRRQGLLHRAGQLRQTDAFELDFEGQRFTFVLAQSLFTHLTLNSIHRCLINVGEVLAAGGAFFATYFPALDGKQSASPVLQRGREPITTYLDRDPYHYHVSAFEWLCDGTELQVQDLGDWSHPRGQHMLKFTRRA